MQQAVEYARARKGPALVHAHVIRPYSHSLSDDERFYKTDAIRDEEALRDPISRTAELILEREWATQDELDRLEQEVRAEVNAAYGRGAGLATAGPLHRNALSLLAGRGPHGGQLRHGR